MFDAFTVMRQLHEVLWYLVEAQTLVRRGPLRTEVDRAHLRNRRNRWPRCRPACGL